MTDILRDYRLEAHRAALLVIDMQRGFIEAGAVMEVPSGRAIVPAIGRLVEACRAAGIPVAFTQFIWSPSVPNLIGELHSQHKPPLSCCMEGHPSAEVVPELAPRAGDLVIRKHGYDAFHDTLLDDLLVGRGRDQLIATGVMTDVCVLATVTAALHRQYRVTVVSDATATLWDEVQRLSLDLIRRCYGRVQSVEDVLAEIRR
jgi:ureidoacrylate peracid hydrolase